MSGLAYVIDNMIASAGVSVKTDSPRRFHVA
jgi:hypothetical protein